MKTLTITNAKKNLGRWLTAAARGEKIGIVCGADIIALRKVDVESTDYAQREYGATPEQVAGLVKATDKRYRSLKRFNFCHCFLECFCVKIFNKFHFYQFNSFILLVGNQMNEMGIGFRWNENKKSLLVCNRDSK